MKSEENYSKLEIKIWRNIPDDGTRISTIELANRIYANATNKPRYPRQSILACTDKLIAKTDHYEEELEIFKSKPRGSQPIYFWKEKRKHNNTV